ncbi:MAG: GNAT family N-acetyltransferase [Thermoleophilaceae bacterium]
MEPRVATEADVPAVVATITSAFDADPVWSWAFPDPALRPEQYTELWGALIRAAMRGGFVWMTPGCEAASVWVAPGEEELTAEEERDVVASINSMLGPRAATVLELLERFDASHPGDRPHYYLSLLGTTAEHRGKGIGMDLLRHNLALIDAEGMPAYLESTNPANDGRYESAGFRRVGEFSTPDGAHTVTTMWREPGGYS